MGHDYGEYTKATATHKPNDPKTTRSTTKTTFKPSIDYHQKAPEPHHESNDYYHSKSDYEQDPEYSYDDPHKSEHETKDLGQYTKEKASHKPYYPETTASTTKTNPYYHPTTTS